MHVNKAGPSASPRRPWPSRPPPAAATPRLRSGAAIHPPRRRGGRRRLGSARARLWRSEPVMVQVKMSEARLWRSEPVAIGRGARPRYTARLQTNGDGVRRSGAKRRRQVAKFVAAQRTPWHDAHAHAKNGAVGLGCNHAQDFRLPLINTVSGGAGDTVLSMTMRTQLAWSSLS